MLKSATWVYIEFVIVLLSLGFQKPVFTWLAVPTMCVIAARLLWLESQGRANRS